MAGDTASATAGAGDAAVTLPLIGGGDKEGVDAGVLVVPNLDDELGDAEADVVQEPEQRMVIGGVWRVTVSVSLSPSTAHSSPHPSPCATIHVPHAGVAAPGTPSVSVPGKVMSTSQFSVGTVFIQALWDMM